MDHYSREEKFGEVFGDDHVIYGDRAEFKMALEQIQPDILHLSRGETRDFYTPVIEQLPKGSVFVVESSIFGKPASDQYFARTDRFLFISHWLEKQSPWAKEKADVVYLPINPRMSEDNLREDLGIAADVLVIGHAQRPDLGHDDFLERVYTPLLRSKKYPILLLSLGHRDFYSPAFQKEFGESIKNLAPTTDEVQLSRFYNTIDVLTHRRIEGETFGMINAEAMMHGRPVITHWSHVDNAQIEVVGDPYWVTAFDDVETYRSRLLELLDNPQLRKQVGLQNKRRAEENFLASKVARDLEQQYKKLFV